MCSLVCLKAKNERMKETQKMVAFSFVQAKNHFANFGGPT